MTAPAQTRRLSPRGRLARAIVTICALTALAVGTFAGSNKLFPVGPMTQYAFYVAPDGDVTEIHVYADTTAGNRVEVTLGGWGVGVKRSDIENQLRRIVADPTLLRPIATAHARLHPHAPAYTRLVVVQTTTHLRDRVPSGSERHVIAVWTVR